MKVSESMTDIIRITKGKQGFSTTMSLKKVSLDDSNNDQRPEMAVETGNTYMSESMKKTLKF